MVTLLLHYLELSSAIFSLSSLALVSGLKKKLVRLGCSFIPSLFSKFYPELSPKPHDGSLTVAATCYQTQAPFTFTSTYLW